MASSRGRSRAGAAVSAFFRGSCSIRLVNLVSCSYGSQPLLVNSGAHRHTHAMRYGIARNRARLIPRVAPARINTLACLGER